MPEGEAESSANNDTGAPRDESLDEEMRTLPFSYLENWNKIPEKFVLTVSIGDAPPLPPPPQSAPELNADNPPHEEAEEKADEDEKMQQDADDEAEKESERRRRDSAYKSRQGSLAQPRGPSEHD